MWHGRRLWTWTSSNWLIVARSYPLFFRILTHISVIYSTKPVNPFPIVTLCFLKKMKKTLQAQSSRKLGSETFKQLPSDQPWLAQQFDAEPFFPDERRLSSDFFPFRSDSVFSHFFESAYKLSDQCGAEFRRGYQINLLDGRFRPVGLGLDCERTI